MKRIALWAGLLVMFAACAPVATGSSSFQPFDLTQPQTVKAGGLYYFAKTYDQTNWIRKTILTNDGRVFSESVQAVGPTLPLTWSDSPDQIREELATQLQSPRCSTIGDGAVGNPAPISPLLYHWRWGIGLAHLVLHQPSADSGRMATRDFFY